VRLRLKQSYRFDIVSTSLRRGFDHEQKNEKEGCQFFHLTRIVERRLPIADQVTFVGSQFLA
jgi:hypothetical protein